jgi:flagella basal body P-ring formation protein FlgA
MDHPRNGLRPLTVKGTIPVDRQGRIHGARWAWGRAAARWLLHGLLLAGAAAHAQGQPASPAAGREAWVDVDLSGDLQLLLQGVARQLAAEHRLDELRVLPVAPVLKLALPPGEVSLRGRPSAPAVFRARFSQWIEVRVNGRLWRTLAVPVTVQAQRPVLQTTRAVAAGEWIAAANTQVVQQDAGGTAAALPPAELQPQRHQALQALPAGTIVRRGDLRDVQVAARGSVVPVVFRSDAIEVQAMGTLMREAREGEAVRVRVPSLRSEVLARRVDGRFMAVAEPGVAR